MHISSAGYHTSSAITMENGTDVSSATANDGRSRPTQMAAWQIDSYGTFEKLMLNNDVKLPGPVGAGEVLVHVKASSVNPIDVMMAGKLERSRVIQGSHGYSTRPDLRGGGKILF